MQLSVQNSDSSKKNVVPNPQKFEAIYNQALLFLNGGHPQEAIEKFVESVPYNPAAVEPAFIIAMYCVFNLQNPQEAEKQFNSALKISPDNPVLMHNLALVKIQLKQYDQAIELWEKAAAAKTQSSILKQNIGRFNQLIGKKNLNADNQVKFQTMLDSIAGDKKSYNPQRGWMYMRLTGVLMSDPIFPKLFSFYDSNGNVMGTAYEDNREPIK